MSERRKYDFERLDKYCKENNVTLLEDYSCCKLTKDVYLHLWTFKTQIYVI